MIPQTVAEKLQGDRVNQQAMAQTKKASAGKWDELNTVKKSFRNLKTHRHSRPNVQCTLINHCRLN